METIMYRIDNQQGLALEHTDLYSVSCKTIMEKDMKKNKKGKLVSQKEKLLCCKGDVWK